MLPTYRLDDSRPAADPTRAGGAASMPAVITLGVATPEPDAEQQQA